MKKKQVKKIIKQMRKDKKEWMSFPADEEVTNYDVADTLGYFIRKLKKII